MLATGFAVISRSQISRKHVLRRQFRASGNIEDDVDALLVGNRPQKLDQAMLNVGIAELVLIIDRTFGENHGVLLN